MVIKNGPKETNPFTVFVNFSVNTKLLQTSLKKKRKERNSSTHKLKIKANSHLEGTFQI